MDHDKLDPFPIEAEGPRGGTYRATDEGLLYTNGDFILPLTNFDCRLLARVVVDDGATTRTLLELGATGPGGTSRFTLTAAEFTSLRWILDEVPGGVLWTGAGVKEHLRVAIQLLSRPVERRVFAHLGWREIDGEHVYLHSGGAVGCAGAVDGVDVDVSSPLDRFRLPPPPCDDDLHTVIRSSLEILRVAPGRITVPLFSAAVRSVLGTADGSIHVAGRSGTGKSQLAALAQSFFGPEMSVGNDLPCSWASTSNFLEATAFAAKDALLVVDDFVPATKQGNEAEMDRLLRAQGNGSGRARLGQASYYPRGLVVSTGEAVPSGKSLVARMVVLRMGDALDWDRLTVLQQQARAGVHAACMAGFLRWLAPRLDNVRAWMRDRVHEVRPMFEIDGVHRRTSDALANLEAAFAMFLRFGVQVRALDPRAADALLGVAHDRLAQCLRDQLAVQQDSDPATMFVSRLRRLIESGDAKLVDLNDASATTGENVIGWIKGTAVYLDPAASLAAAQSGEHCETLACSEGQIAAACHRARLLARVDTRGDRVRFKIRLVVAGSRRQVLALAPGVLDVAHLTDGGPRPRVRPPASPIRWDQPIPATPRVVAPEKALTDAALAPVEAARSHGPLRLVTPGGKR